MTACQLSAVAASTPTDHYLETNVLLKKAPDRNQSQAEIED